VLKFSCERGVSVLSRGEKGILGSSGSGFAVLGSVVTSLGKEK
jgi:hypothetical protein